MFSATLRSGSQDGTFSLVLDGKAVDGTFHISQQGVTLGLSEVDDATGEVVVGEVFIAQPGDEALSEASVVLIESRYDSSSGELLSEKNASGSFDVGLAFSEIDKLSFKSADIEKFGTLKSFVSADGSRGQSHAIGEVLTVVIVEGIGFSTLFLFGLIAGGLFVLLDCFWWNIFCMNAVKYLDRELFVPRLRVFERVEVVLV